MMRSIICNSAAALVACCMLYIIRYSGSRGIYSRHHPVLYSVTIYSSRACIYIHQHQHIYYIGGYSIGALMMPDSRRGRGYHQHHRCASSLWGLGSEAAVHRRLCWEGGRKAFGSVNPRGLLPGLDRSLVPLSCLRYGLYEDVSRRAGSVTSSPPPPPYGDPTVFLAG